MNYQGFGVPSVTKTLVLALFYVLSGCSQPLLMTICRAVGVANPSSQLYMLFYYMGPASVIIPLLWRSTPWPSDNAILKGCGIALFDLTAQMMNWRGAALAGPTIFAIVYSSVTIWAAVFSRVLLSRRMSHWQWLSIFVVFGGLTLTTTNSMKMGDEVLEGFLLVLLGSAAHSLTYVFSEGVMTVGESRLTVQQNCAVQGSVASSILFVWQLIYTLPHWEKNIEEPIEAAGSSYTEAFGVLILFAMVSFIHAVTFFHTLKYFPAGATSAGVMKGLQAVLVFVFTHIAFCGRQGGQEMCFDRSKLLSLVTVVTGVTGYGLATSDKEKGHWTSFGYESNGYESIQDTDEGFEVNL
eukprot:Nitzschia sp. Nitz4//scaffold85_size83877//43468//44526//NITZ4_005231-RA/size83877-processed-gene-0.122-mRNA-1//1//CDS//3329559143//1112//frame0